MTSLYSDSFDTFVHVHCTLQVHIINFINNNYFNNYDIIYLLVGYCGDFLTVLKPSSSFSAGSVSRPPSLSSSSATGCCCCCGFFWLVFLYLTLLSS